MAGWTSLDGEFVLEVARIATLRGSIADRAAALLEPLHRLVPFEGHWLALLDTDTRGFASLAVDGYDPRTQEYLRGPAVLGDVELVGLHRTRPPMRVRDFPVPPDEVPAWAEYLWPSGFREGIGVGLFTPDGRYLGILSLHTETVDHPTEHACDLIGVLAPLIAQALDAMRVLETVADRPRRHRGNGAHPGQSLVRLVQPVASRPIDPALTAPASEQRTRALTRPAPAPSIHRVSGQQCVQRGTRSVPDGANRRPRFHGRQHGAAQQSTQPAMAGLKRS